MSEHERNKYLEAYYDNEADANKNMSFANAAAGLYMLVIWIFYLTGFFKIHSDTTLVLINIFFPISILVLLSPLLYVFAFKDIVIDMNIRLTHQSTGKAFQRSVIVGVKKRDRLVE